MQYLKVAAVALLAVLSLASCKQKAASQKEAVTYPLLRVSPEDRTLSISYSAVIEGKQDVEVRPQVSGRFYHRCVGQRRSQGEERSDAVRH